MLLVEDNSADALLVRRAFQRANIRCTIHVVTNGEEAIAYLRGDGQYADRQQFPLPSLVLLDLKLPRRSGFDVLLAIRQHPSLRRLPIVVLTSSRELKDVNRAYELGANSYVTKVADPVNMTDLMKVIHRYWTAVNESPSIVSHE
jgi:CheY-like chemotaxis protein